jgi:flagellar hook-associated protein 2
LSSRTSLVSNAAGEFQYSYNGNYSQIIKVPPNTTLEDFAKLINESPGNPGVRASIINDGLGTAQSYHLIITGIDSGAANQVEIISSDLTNIAKEDFLLTRQATNAVLKIDDYPPGEDNWIQKTSNLITDMLEGASVRLKDSGVVTLNIANNDDDMADKVQAFVDEYNALLDYIDEITKIVLNEEDEAEYGSQGILVGNYAVNILRSNLRMFIGERGKGFSFDGDVYSLLTQIGMESNSDTRRIEFDRDKFKSELNSNADALIKLFSADNSGAIINNNDFIYMSGTSETKSGLYEFEVSYSAPNVISEVKYKDLTTNITYSSADGDILIGADGSFTVFKGSARGVAITGVNVDGNNKFKLSIKDGKAKSFDEELKKLFDEKEGLTKVLERNYESIIKNIDKRIERENMRIRQVKNRLEMRFARLEVNMQNWNGQMERLQQQIQQLPSGK